MMTPIPLETLRRHAAQTPHAPALTFAGTTLSFGELEAASERVADALIAIGVGVGDRVAIIARNLPAHFELYFACGMVGAIMLPVNWRLAASEINAILSDAAPSLILVAAEFETCLETLVPTIVALSALRLLST